MLGKKLYKTSMLNFFRLGVLAIVIFFLNNFYLETFTYENFQLMRRFKIVDVILYHYKYPGEFITFFFIIIVPAFYYAFVRGIRFHEKAFVVNKGLPFMNSTYSYEDVKTYKLLHPQRAISIHTKKGEAIIVVDNDVERVIAILDQHEIQGDLAQDDLVKLFASYKKFMIILVSALMVLFFIRKLGFFIQ